ncbi:MAG: radical SAM protein [Ignavibacteriales bacterium]|nr:radical SAM protein [Ignavibacteriales bacterium]
MGVVQYVYTNATNIAKKEVSKRTRATYSKPTQIAIMLIDYCNARCLMCDNWKNKKIYLKKETLLQALDDLKDWIGDGFVVNFSGGEPLIYPGIYDVFRHCADRGVVAKISTNGINLTPKICDKVIASGLKYLTISIDSHRPEVHDKFRGTPGLWEKNVAALAYLREHGDMTLGVSSVVMKPNGSELKEMADFFLGLDIDRWLLQSIEPIDVKFKDWKSYDYWVDDLEKLGEGIEYIKELKSEDPRIMNTRDDLDLIRDYFADPSVVINSEPCFLGLDRMNIQANGDVDLCFKYPPIGNLYKERVRDIWDGEQARKIREAMKRCKMPCLLNCNKELSLGEKFKKFRQLYRSGLFNK